MNYIYISISILVFIFVLDISFSLFKLKISGIIKGYKLITTDVGYISKKGLSFVGSASKRILIVGDSTAVGSCVDPKDTIGGRLSEKFGVEVINLAINGAKTKDVIRQFESLSNQKFYLTIVHVGNMDISKFTNLNTINNDISHLLDKLKLISEHVVLFRGGNFGSIPLFPYFVRFILGIRSRKIRRIFKNIAELKSVVYVEKFMNSSNDIFLKRPYHYYSWDLLHLNKNGYEVWFDYLLAELNKNNIELTSN